jgi:glycosyltransferase involved in cell wall biosynthesis
MKKLTCFTFEGWHGVESGLRTTTNVLGYGSVHSITNTPAGIAHVLRTIKTEDPEILLLAGYGKLFQEIIKIRSTHSKIVVKWSSNILQSELTNEMNALAEMVELLKRGRYFGLAFNHEPSVWAMKNRYPNLNFFYMPEVPLPPKKNPTKMSLSETEFHVDLICTANGRKNIYNQLLALSGIARVHVNYSLPDYAALASQFDNVTNHGKLPNAQYDSLISSVALGCQVSANESFNYVASEHMFFGVPVLASRFVPAVFETKDAEIHKYLIVHQIDSAQEINERVKILKEDPILLAELGLRCSEEIQIISQKRQQQIKECFETL